jgi:flagellar protein FlaG
MTAFASTSNGNAASRASTHPAVKPPAEALQQAVQKLEVHMLGIGSALEFRVDDNTGTTVVTVRDKESGDVIRQIPSEEALWLAENLDKISSALLRTSA